MEKAKTIHLQEYIMQEVFPFPPQPHALPDFKKIGNGMKRLLIAIWKPTRLILEALFTPPPGQKYIEESRLRAMRLTGHF